MIGPLPILIPDCPADETVKSLAIRHADAQGYPKTSWITDLIDTSLARLSQDPPAIDRLARLLDWNRNDLIHRAHLASKADPGLINFWGHEITVDHLDRAPMRVCPLCMREKAYLRAVWELTLCRVCPTHGCLLIEVCPPEGHELDPNWPNLGTCHACECDYTQHEGSGSYPIATAFWRLVRAKMDGAEADVKAGWMPDLRACSLPALLDLAACLQALKFPGPPAATMSRGLQAFNKERSRRFVEDQEWCLALLTDWPQRFDAYCDEMLQSPTRQTELTERAIGALHPIMSWSLSAGTMALKERVLSRVSEKRRILLQSFLGSSYQDDDEHRYLLMHEVDAILGIHEAATRELFGSTSLAPGKKTGSTRKRLFVTPGDPVRDVLDDIAANGATCKPELEYLTFQEACLALQGLNARRRTLLNGMRCGDIAYFFESGKQPNLGTARIAYESFIAFFEESLKLDLQQWIPFRLAALLSVLDPQTLMHLRTKKRLQMRGEPGVPDTRAVLLHSLFQFKRGSRVLARLGGVQGASRQKLAATATSAGIRAISGLGSGGSTIIIKAIDVGTVLVAFSGAGSESSVIVGEHHDDSLVDAVDPREESGP